LTGGHQLLSNALHKTSPELPFAKGTRTRRVPVLPNIPIRHTTSAQNQSHSASAQLRHPRMPEPSLPDFAVIFLSSAHPQVQQRCGARQAVCHRLDFRAVAVRHAAEASACMLLTCARAQSSSGVKSAARMQGAEPGLLGSGCLLPTDPRRIWTAQSSSGVESTSSGE